MSFINAYIAAFQSTYPQKKVDIRPAQHGNYRVVINGDAGDIVLSEFDMRTSTRFLNNQVSKREYPRATAKLGDMARFVS